MEEVEKLEQQIKYYAEKYYNGEPEITDEQFDSLVDRLKMLKPNSSVLVTGWGFEVNGNKIKHKYSHIGSLDKTKTFKDIPDRFKNKIVYVSPKLDGLSAVAYYKEGKLVQGITRGNGEYGKDITDKLKLILGSEINDKTFTGAVRGELIINDKNWLELQGKYDNLIAPRNFAAGIINRKEIDEDIKYIDMVLYKVTGQENINYFSNRVDILMWLTNNFKHVIPIYYFPDLTEEAWNSYHEKVFDDFKTSGYGLDGLVLTNFNVQYNTQTKGYVYDEVAFKFAAETGETKILDMEWTLSRTNRLVPVAIVEPVELSGAVITRCTANNAKMVQDLGLGAGAVVEIMRSNEVIPQIVNVIEESEQPLPTLCPCCSSQLEWVGVDLKCTNKNCTNISQSDLQQWCEVIGETDGLQWVLMKQYLDLYNIHSLEDLYSKERIVMNDLITRKLSITEEKIKQFFEKLYINGVDISKALLALNIPRLGKKTSELLSKNQNLCKSLIGFATMPHTLSEQDKIKLNQDLTTVVKVATTIEIFQNIDKLQHLKYIDSRIVYNEVNQQNIKYIAVTGSLQTMKRKDFEKYVKQYGYELSSNIKKCEYLVNNDINSTSSKNKLAKENNIPIISEQQFLDLLKNI